MSDGIERTVIKAMTNMKPDECRELGQLLLALADSPRDASWDVSMRLALSKFPAAPESNLAQAIAAGNARVKAHNDELWAAGWHPDQMRKKLVELGYTGTAAA